MTLRCSRASALAAALCLLAPVARAVPLTWTFTGVLGSYVPPNGSSVPIPAPLAALGVELGAPVSGSMTFESTTPNSWSNPQDPYNAIYDGVEDFRIAVGGWSLVDDHTQNAIQNVFNPTYGSGEQAYLYLSDSSGVYGSVYLLFSLEDRTSQVITSNSLLLSPPPLLALDPFSWDGISPPRGTQITLIDPAGANFGQQFGIKLTSLVPEPDGSAALIGVTGLVALAVKRRTAKSAARSASTHLGLQA
jgi:hypothetical protein